MKFLILGDVHACWEDLNITLAKAIGKHPDITHVIQVGDFGYGHWPHNHKPFKASKGFLNTESLAVYERAEKMWLDGNHENFTTLEKDGGAWQPGWKYMPRGSTLEVVREDGRTVRAMFFGGATSVDKDRRKEGVTWWPQENITYSQIQDTLDTVEGWIDVIFSHEHPSSVPYSEERYENDIHGTCEKQGLQALKDRYNPDWWFFGHHHVPQSGIVKNTRWYCCPIIESHWYTIWDGERVYTHWT